MDNTEHRTRVAPEAVGQDSPNRSEPRRQAAAGRGLPGFLGTAVGIFSVVFLLLAIFLVVILVVA